MLLAGEKEDEMENGLNGDGFTNKKHNDIEEIDTNLLMVLEFAGDTRDGQKRSSNLCQKSSLSELR